MKFRNQILIIVYCFLAILNSANLCAQVSSKFKQVRAEVNEQYLGVGWYQATFLNSNFENNHSTNTIKHKFGFNANYKLIYHPLIFDADYSLSAYDFNASNIIEGYKTNFHNFSVALNLNCFPYSKVFLPFLGIGYQGAFLEVKDKRTDEPELVSRVKLPSTFWNVGVLFKFKNTLLTARYSQTMPTNVTATIADQQVFFTDNQLSSRGLTVTLSILNFINYEERSLR